MNPVIPPLKSGDRGEAVGNLQESLLLLLDRAVVLAPEDERRSVTALLRRERQQAPQRRAMGILPGREPPQPVYGDGTARAVTLFQQNNQSRPTGQVDEPTANAINTAIRKLGVMPVEVVATRPPQPETIRPATIRPTPREQHEPAARTQGQAIPHPGEPIPLGQDIAAQPEPAYQVKGTVRLADGYPASGLAVSAFDRDLRSEELLGRGASDAAGFYRISYHPHQFLRREKGSADLAVKVFAADASLLATSPILFNAPAVAEVDITIPAERWLPPSLFEKIGRALRPLLDGVKIEELEEDGQHQDMSFLSGETGYEKTVLARFAMAHKLAQHGLQPEFWFAVLGGSFFTFDEARSLKDQLSS